MLEEWFERTEKLRERVSDLRGYLDLEAKESERARIEGQLAKPGFWDQPEASREILQRRSRLGAEIEIGRQLLNEFSDLEALVELAHEGEPVEGDLKQAVHGLEQRVDQVEVQHLLCGEHDFSNSFIDIHAGAGGTEAQDWAEMLLRMYLRWADRRAYQTEILGLQQGEGAGIKSATVRVEGSYAYGYLSAEIGVHRLVRISPFDANARRHTSFASVYAYPEIDDRIKIEIADKDLRIDTYRSSGAGGQHVNVTDSAVRITHLPTSIVVQCQNERSQHRNRDMAMRILRARLYEHELKKRDEARDQVEGQKRDIDFGSQIRSYVLQPYRRVKDLRSGHETGNVDSVLDGDLDPLIKSFLVTRSRSRREAGTSS
ncbi:MAG: peptide chain release factor 2 [Acidobacteriota bacterium]